LNYSLHTAEKLAKDSLADCMVIHHGSNWFVENPADKMEGWKTILGNYQNESQYDALSPAGFTSLEVVKMYSNYRQSSVDPSFCYFTLT
jgi:hypothetical protein